MTIQARYSGTCGECGGRWQPGDLIRADEPPLGSLPTKGEPCPCGCRRDVEPLNPGEAWAEDYDAATTPPEATSAPLTAQEPTEAPEDGEGAERPTAANLGRIGWMRPSMSEPWFLVHEAPDGWSEDSTNDALWFADEQPDAIFTPFTPADFGWTVLGEGQVAVDRDDLEWMRPREMSSADMDDFSTARNRLIAALDAEADDDRY